MHYLIVGITLCLFWLLLSGHYTALLLGLGALSVGLVILFLRRMDRVDGERQPLHIPPMLITYWAWHFVEIVKCSIDVARRIINPKLPISPTVVRVRAGQHSPIATATYANSITLTPGTVTVRVEGDDVEFLDPPVGERHTTDGHTTAVDEDVSAGGLPVRQNSVRRVRVVHAHGQVIRARRVEAADPVEAFGHLPVTLAPLRSQGPRSSADLVTLE